MKANVLVKTDNLSTAEWLRWRRKGIGGSDVSAIVGVSKWQSVIELWLSKTNQKHDEVEENEAMTWGKILEPTIRNHFAETTGKKVIEIRAILQHKQYPFMIADLDGLTEDDDGEPAILECKCVSEYKRHEWADGNVPIYYQCQVQHYLAITGLNTAYVVALVGGNSFIVREIHADKELQAMLIAVEADFWNKVQNMIRPQPDASDACKNLLDSLYKGGKDGKTVVLPDTALEYVYMYLEACNAEEEAQEKKQLASNNLKELLGDYNSAKCQRFTVSWKPFQQERLDAKALKEAEPEIYAKYVKTINSRRFTVK